MRPDAAPCRRHFSIVAPAAFAAPPRTSTCCCNTPHAAHPPCPPPPRFHANTAFQLLSLLPSKPATDAESCDCEQPEQKPEPKPELKEEAQHEQRSGNGGNWLNGQQQQQPQQPQQPQQCLAAHLQPAPPQHDPADVERELALHLRALDEHIRVLRVEQGRCRAPGGGVVLPPTPPCVDGAAPHAAVGIASAAAAAADATAQPAAGADSDGSDAADADFDGRFKASDVLRR